MPILLLVPIASAAKQARQATAATTVTEGTAIAEGTSPAGPASPLTVSLTSITPKVAVPKAPITIRGSVRNTGAVWITSAVARALVGQRPLTSRQAVSDWATSAGPTPALTEVARIPLGKTLVPGAVVNFVLTIPASAISHGESFAVLPLRVDAVGTIGATTQGAQELGDLNTFLPTLSSLKRFEPLSIAWLIPLTLDPDPALHGTDSPARTAAWTKAIGPGSRLDRLIQGTENQNVTWAIDPAILGPRKAPSAGNDSPAQSPTPSTSRSPSPGTTSGPDPVTEATTALANRLRAAAPMHTLWSLPYADPDLSALLPLTSDHRALAALISQPSPVDVAVGPSRSNAAWPVEGTLTPRTETQLRRAFASPALGAAVTSGSTLNSPHGPTGDASRASRSGLPLLAYDDALSSTVAQTSSRATGALTVQRFLADSMALLGERPGTPHRSVLIAEPRTFAGDPIVLRALFAAIAKATWLTPTTTEKLLAPSEKPAPATPSAGSTSPGSPGQSATTSPPVNRGEPTSTDPLAPGASPLTAGHLATMPGTLSAITGLGSILADGRLFTSRWTDAQIQQLSARWRGHPQGIAAIDAATTTAMNTIRQGIQVAPSSVNFFADRGVMQVTVVNNLAVPIHDVHLSLTPAQPRLRIDQQPAPLKIGARSRTNVPLHVTSIAAGLVRVDAVLTAPNGTPLGESASVAVRVQPPSTWIYWGLGALAGLVLVLGTYRSLRRGSTRGSRPEAQELLLDDRVLND